jgi:hypothetical protein
MDNKNKICVDVNHSASVHQCESTVVDPGDVVTAPPGPTIIKVPVDLAVVDIQSNLVANLHFPDPVLEIKDIKKRVKIVQCRLMTPPAAPGAPAAAQFSIGPFQLFIKGFVRKNIQYATPCPNSSGACVSSEIKSLTVDVPFECVTPVTLTRAAQLPQSNLSSEFDFFREQKLGHGFPEKDHLLSSDLSQFHQESRQFYNELPFCELLESSITEWDEAVDRTPLPGNAPFEEGTFRTVVEKMFLRFRVKILQKQQVAVTAIDIP